MRTSKIKTLTVISVIGLLAVAAAAAFAFATQNGDRDEVANLAGAKLTLSDAINYAQSEVPGNALSAVLANEGDPLSYKVEVVQLGKTRQVLVDAQTGRVISNVEDKADKEEGDHGE